MRPAALSAARLLLLAGPTALAFFSGGYFDEPRAWAGLGVWLLVAVGLLAQSQPLPRRRGTWLALGGLGLLAAWTLLSIGWAPIADSAYHAGQIAVLYVGALVAATLLLATRGAQRAVEPALAAGTLVVIGYGISERLLPGLLSFSRSVSAQGRLEQPLTYWNAMGELAALGFVLSARIAGDSTRSVRLRIAAAAACAPLGLGLYLTFSRGALFAWAAGLLTLVIVAQRREQLWAILVTVSAGALAALVAAPFRGVTALTGAQSTRERQGAFTLALLIVIGLVTAIGQWWLVRHERAAELRLPRRAPLIAVVAICAGLALAIVVGAKESSTVARPLSAGATRYETLQSDRYAYWRVALHAFADEPLRGVGAGGWAVYWLRLRKINEGAQDAHSLPLQTAAELGLVGLALLAAFLAGVGLAARDASRIAVAQAAGPIAGFVVYVAHAPLDWDWQMPAVTLVALILAGSLLAQSEFTAPRRSAALRG
jgi:O-Antigen ligase